METMKPMVYECDPGKADRGEILAEGEYRGFSWCIVSYGTHPCAYVGIPKGHRLYGMRYTMIECDGAHGGLTYSERGRPIGDCWNIGWDYAHAGDYTAVFPYGRKWTTEEILKHVHCVIDSISEEDGRTRHCYPDCPGCTI